MSGLFDQLKKQVEKARENQGVGPADLLTLPVAQRRVMRILLREIQLSYPDIVTAVSHLPPPQQLTIAELDDALIQLTEAGWLIRMGQAELITYRVDLRRKPGSKVSTNMWGTLEERLQAQQTKRKKP